MKAGKYLSLLAQPVRDVAHTLMGMVLILSLALTTACGGGGGSSAAAPQPSGSTPQTGEVIVSITDAPGDFVMYEIGVDAITLIRANGDEVDALPLSTRVDFAELTEVTELLSIATVPVGNYETVTLTLNFQDAEVWVQDESGEAVQAVVQDASGNPLTTLDTALMLTTSDVIRVSPGAPAAFALDFDLDASNEIDLSGSSPVVTVEPLLLATPQLETDREHRVRGLLAGVDDRSFDMAVRPFKRRSGEFGVVSVQIDDETVYEIDGERFTGASGLAALGELDLRSPVVTHGEVVIANGERQILAHEVLAGDSVPWVDADVVKGVVAARQGDTLTVRGAAVDFSDGTRGFRGEFTVLVDAGTGVTAPAAGNPSLSANSISVGQRIVAWGARTDDRTLLAERVRLPLSQLTGVVVAADPLAVDLYWLNSRRPGIYDFSGTGMSADDDADPDFYQIDTSLLPLQNLNSGDLARIRGLVNEFGMAPDDFLARTVVDVQTDMRAATLYAGWQDGTAQPFIATEPARIDLDLSAARQSLKLRGVPRDYLAALDEVALTAPDSGNGVYAVRVRGAGEIHLYRGFADLVDALVAELEQGRILHRITAQGRYNSSSNELTTGRAGFVFSTGGSE